ILLLIVLTFVWFHFKITNYYENHNKNIKPIARQMVSNLSKPSEEVLTPFSVNQLKRAIDEINQRQEVHNLKTFGPLLDNDLVVIIQVHNRSDYLLSLIESFAKTKHIEEVLLVFSHDLFDPKINSMVTSITFCKTIQIFYPKSLQLNPNSFPGDSAEDCPRDVTVKDFDLDVTERALRIGCKNRFNSDSYGHFREAKFTQTKHHFWWKVNAVLDGLDITRHHSGHFMFLEEDHYLSPDTFNDDKSKVITLGSYVRSVEFNKNADKIERSRWISSRHNMAFIIDRDWSLQFISENCLKSPLNTLFVSIPRVYHTGECGLHHKTKRCNNKEMIETIEDTFKVSKNYLFPKQMILQQKSQKPFRMPKANGGWADPRDHELCLNHTHQYF
ncbi:unnamed protein product, partial [Medioppia subpectinata]